MTAVKSLLELQIATCNCCKMFEKLFMPLRSRGLLKLRATLPCQTWETIQAYHCICSSLFQNRSISFTRNNFASSKEEDAELEAQSTGDKILKLKLQTTRFDAIIKAGLNISRSKIEKAFYEDRVRINGARPKKKSQLADEGDEIDMVRGPNKVNPLFIDVNRLEVVEIGEGAEGDEYDSGDDQDAKIPVILKRSKSLTIENYPIPWKGNSSDG